MTAGKTSDGAADALREERPDRREFLRSVVRYAALGALAVGGAFAWTRRPSAADDRCTRDHRCSTCPVSNRCPWREETSEEPND